MAEFSSDLRDLQRLSSDLGRGGSRPQDALGQLCACMAVCHTTQLTYEND